MQPYYVISPEYGTKIPILDDGSGPIEYGCDFVEVEARTKREALLIGVRRMLRERRSWALDQRSDGANPFVGYKVELARCGHGIPHFVLVDGNPVYQKCWGCDRKETE